MPQLVEALDVLISPEMVSENMLLAALATPEELERGEIAARSLESFAQVRQTMVAAGWDTIRICTEVEAGMEHYFRYVNGRDGWDREKVSQTVHTMERTFEDDFGGRDAFRVVCRDIAFRSYTYRLWHGVERFLVGTRPYSRKKLDAFLAITEHIQNYFIHEHGYLTDEKASLLDDLHVKLTKQLLRRQELRLTWEFQRDFRRWNPLPADPKLFQLMVEGAVWGLQHDEVDAAITLLTNPDQFGGSVGRRIRKWESVKQAAAECAERIAQTGSASYAAIARLQTLIGLPNIQKVDELMAAHMPKSLDGGYVEYFFSPATAAHFPVSFPRIVDEYIDTLATRGYSAVDFVFKPETAQYIPSERLAQATALVFAQADEDLNRRLQAYFSAKKEYIRDETIYWLDETKLAAVDAQVAAYIADPEHWREFYTYTMGKAFLLDSFEETLDETECMEKIQPLIDAFMERFLQETRPEARIFAFLLLTRFAQKREDEKLLERLAGLPHMGGFTYQFILYHMSERELLYFIRQPEVLAHAGLTDELMRYGSAGTGARRSMRQSVYEQYFRYCRSNLNPPKEDEHRLWRDEDIQTFELLAFGRLDKVNSLDDYAQLTIDGIAWDGVGLDLAFTYMGNKKRGDVLHTIWTPEILGKILSASDGTQIDVRSINRLKKLLEEASRATGEDPVTGDDIYEQLGVALNQYQPEWGEDLIVHDEFPPIEEFVSRVQRRSLEMDPVFETRMKELADTDPITYAYVHAIWIHARASKAAVQQVMLDPKEFWGRTDDDTEVSLVPSQLWMLGRDTYRIALHPEDLLPLVAHGIVDELSVFHTDTPRVPVTQMLSTGVTLSGEIILPSDPRFAAIGDDTLCCMRWGSDYHNVYMMYGFGAVIVSAHMEGKEPHVIAQSVLTSNLYDETIPRGNSIYAQKGMLVSRLGEDFLERYPYIPRVAAGDNVEAKMNAVKRTGAGAPGVVQGLYADTYGSFAQSHSGFTNVPFVVGKKHSDIQGIGESTPNSCVLAHPLSYTDNTEETVELVSGFFSARSSEESRRGVAALTKLDGLSVAYIAEKVKGSDNPDLPSPIHMVNAIYGSQLCARKHGAPDTTLGWFDEKGVLRAYLIAYIAEEAVKGEEEKRLCVFVEDAVCLPGYEDVIPLLLDELEVLRESHDALVDLAVTFSSTISV